jgi:hypothetical protein
MIEIPQPIQSKAQSSSCIREDVAIPNQQLPIESAPFPYVCRLLALKCVGELFTTSLGPPLPSPLSPLPSLSSVFSLIVLCLSLSLGHRFLSLRNHYRCLLIIAGQSWRGRKKCVEPEKRTVSLVGVDALIWLARHVCPVSEPDPVMFIGRGFSTQTSSIYLPCHP